MNPLAELHALVELFPEPEPLIAGAEHVAAPLMPDPYRRMLAHEHHMTVTMEQHHGGPVDVKVLARRDVAGSYCRKIVLTKRGTDRSKEVERAGSNVEKREDTASGQNSLNSQLSTLNSKVVQFGIVRFDFSYVTPSVRDEILSEQIPLGRVLIRHNVLRHIDLGALLRIEAGPGLANLLAMPDGGLTYGRLATIFCNGRPAVDLLEITAPLT